MTRHQMFGSGEVREHLVNFRWREDDREMFRSFCARECSDLPQITPEHLVIEESDSIEGLVLGGRRDFQVLCQMGEECMDFWSPHLEGMSFVVKEDESSYPVSVCFGGARAEVTEGGGCADLVEEFWFVHMSGAATCLC
jgi:hypothetical protein